MRRKLGFCCASTSNEGFEHHQQQKITIFFIFSYIIIKKEMQHTCAPNAFNYCFVMIGLHAESSPLNCCLSVFPYYFSTRTVSKRLGTFLSRGIIRKINFHNFSRQHPAQHLWDASPQMTPMPPRRAHESKQKARRESACFSHTVNSVRIQRIHKKKGQPGRDSV